MPSVPLVLAHGFTQTGGSWGRFGELLSAGRSVVAPDLAGHGSHASVRADVAEAARLLLEDSGGGSAGRGPIDLLGYSMGARIALRAALEEPERIRSLVLVSGTAGIEDPDARAERRHRDDARADELERSGDLDGFLRAWLDQPMFAHLGPDNDQWASRMASSPAGLASSLRLAGTGAQDPLWDRLVTLRPPLLALAGANDVRFGLTARRLVGSAPHAAWNLVPGAGHAVHLEQPDCTARIVTHWLDTVAPEPPGS